MEPEQTTSMISAIAGLIPVLGGAIIGLFSGLIGTKYSHKLTTSSEALAEHRLKLETLVAETYEINIWLKKLENYYFYGGDEPLEQSPIAKIQALTLMYFPELSDEVESLDLAETNYRGWLIQGAQLRVQSKSPTPPRVHLDQLDNFYGPVKTATDAVLNAAKNKMMELKPS